MPKFINPCPTCGRRKILSSLIIAHRQRGREVTNCFSINIATNVD